MKKIKRIFSYGVFFFFLTKLAGCTYDKTGAPSPNTDYPDDIARIMASKCATSGCHNSASKVGAGGLDLSSWNHLFEGAVNGSSVIPFRPDQSYLMYFINTYTDLGISLSPTMPKDETPLSHDEVTTVRNWIRNGAPDKNGNIKFCCDPARKKYYVCNQGCDIVTVFDSQTRLPMRVIDVGVNPNQIENPHSIVVSPDGNYWYVIFTAAQVMQKFRTSDDSLVGQVTLGAGLWNSMVISDDSHYAFVVNYSPDPDGSVAFVDLEAMTLNITYTGLNSPHGSALSHDFKTLFVTAQVGNYLYKFNITNPMNPLQSVVKLEHGPQVFTSRFDPHQVKFSPDGTKYFVTCQKSAEVRVMSVATDTLLAVIPTGVNPQELVFSESRPYLFVTCTNDSVTIPGLYGSVSVINYQTNSFIKSIYTGWQPHGINLDDDLGMVYVANRNVNPNGEASHHSTTCGNQNGYITIIDMTTPNPADMDVIDYKVEVSVDPYEVAVRK